MTRLVSFPLALATVLTLSLTACGGDDDKKSVPSPADSPPSPSITPSTPKRSPGTTVSRTTVELTKALLVRSDLPDGFVEEKPEPDTGDGPFSSSSSRCKTLVKYLNATKAPGSTASVTRSFSAGQEGPYIDFGLDAMGTAEKVADLRDAYAGAVKSCSKVTLKTESETATSMKVEKIAAPESGTDAFAFRLTGTSGPQRGLEYTAAITGLDDVIVSVGVLAGQGTELVPATEAATTKAQQALEIP